MQIFRLPLLRLTLFVQHFLICSKAFLAYAISWALKHKIGIITLHSGQSTYVVDIFESKIVKIAKKIDQKLTKCTC